MKKILVYGFLSFLMIFFVSCDSWLDLNPKSSITVSSMWKNSSDAKAALNGAFNRFRSAFQTNYIVWGDYRTGFYGNGIDNGSVDRGNVWNNLLIPSTVGTNWAGLYTAINDCNLILKHTPDIIFEKESDKDYILGSAYYLRAFMYYYIVRIWGDAPVLTEGFESDNQEGLFPTRDVASKIYEQIEKDLQNAYDLISSSGGGSSPYGISKAAVNMLQTDFYLWEAKVNKKKDALGKAENAITYVLNSGLQLSDSYESVFRDDINKEIIFSIAFVEAENTSSFAGDFLLKVSNVPVEYQNNPVQIGSSAQWVSMTSEHKNFLWGVENDTRASVNILDYTTPDDQYYSWINKYLGTWKEGTRIFDSDVRVYRFAEALLFKAEIEIAHNNNSEALKYINQVAKRAYGKDNYYAGSYTRQEIENILLDERLKELASEGKSWFDLIRLGQVFNRVKSLHGRENELNILLWPVNNASINTNPAITQTPGYE
ncbi:MULTISPECIES: RagB/SusD family nutrient uptake outer membrane protein [unclassified Parabacteroides]|uniref:RagB/SusD family nutrient uptake outer membrane protein n=1 Tax=unclassified Parabacteroides TaxID=2649774 RepID=UPI000EFDB338|nr:RagB/SusD family nutrient uptake outer membrane protein [Parabacteroides sp. TM07-1AC]RHU28848.1 RagB/SusD family nutrient uptake outer membrane protein [Parabacteroides sp. TM07-1AC]